MKTTTMLAAGAAMLAFAAPADAALLQFTINGVDTGSGITPAPIEFASFQIDSRPVVDPANATLGSGFAIGNVAGVFQYGTTIVTTPQTISFYNSLQLGGLFVGIGDLLAFNGPQLYTGSELTPTFLTGTFTLTDFDSGSPITLTIAEVAAIPEPATWTTMLVGFGLIGGTIRYRRRRTAVAFA